MMEFLKQFITKRKSVDFEELGHKTMLDCREVGRAKEICACYIQCYADEIAPQVSKRYAAIERVNGCARGLQAFLYGSGVPIAEARCLLGAIESLSCWQ